VGMSVSVTGGRVRVSLGPATTIVQAPTAPAVAPPGNEHPSDIIPVIESAEMTASRTKPLGPRAYVTARR
jgi:hypothetical protein